DVVDRRRLAEEPEGHREGRLVPRLTALALDRFEQSGLLAADVGARSSAELDIEPEAVPTDVIAEHPVMSCLVDRVLEPLAREGVLPSEVDVATVGPGCESRDRERLEHREGVELHHEPILERPWLGLVGV